MSDNLEKNETLTESSIERQNILNNPFALKKVEESLSLGGVQHKEEIQMLEALAKALDEAHTKESVWF